MSLQGWRGCISIVVALRLGLLFDGLCYVPGALLPEAFLV